jgi:cytochrome c-type biogenesis protein CcmH/NrfG
MSTGPPSAQLASRKTTSAEAGARQAAMERRVVEAWMASESDPDRTERAADFARKAASVYPRNARIQFFAARLDARTDRLGSAVKRFEQVLELEPGNEDARRELTRAREMALPPARKGFSLKKLFGRDGD